MNDRRPMLDRDSRARLGRKLSSDYNQMPDPMMPARLQDLVARLLATSPLEPQSSVVTSGQPGHPRSDIAA
jgi:hypothetical protein